MIRSHHNPIAFLLVLTVGLFSLCGCSPSRKKLAIINDQIGPLAIVNDVDICSPRFHPSALLPLNPLAGIEGTLRGGAEGVKFAAKSGSGEGAGFILPFSTTIGSLVGAVKGIFEPPRHPAYVRVRKCLYDSVAQTNCNRRIAEEIREQCAAKRPGLQPDTVESHTPFLRRRPKIRHMGRLRRLMPKRRTPLRL